MSEAEVYAAIDAFMAIAPPRNERVLEAQERIEYYVNQGWRQAETLAVRGDEILIAYRMPRGMVSMVVLKQDLTLAATGSVPNFDGSPRRGVWANHAVHGETQVYGLRYKAVRNVALKTCPKYWRALVEAPYCDTLENVIDSMGWELED